MIGFALNNYVSRREEIMWPRQRLEFVAWDGFCFFFSGREWGSFSWRGEVMRGDSKLEILQDMGNDESEPS